MTLSVKTSPFSGTVISICSRTNLSVVIGFLEGWKTQFELEEQEAAATRANESRNNFKVFIIVSCIKQVSANLMTFCYICPTYEKVFENLGLGESSCLFMCQLQPFGQQFRQGQKGRNRQSDQMARERSSAQCGQICSGFDGHKCTIII